eukprot:12616933-Ditylum_brightwellii.AAC.1
MVEYQEEKDKLVLNMGIYIPMFKRCKQCLSNFIQEQTRKAEGGPDQGGTDQPGGGVDSNFKNAPDPGVLGTYIVLDKMMMQFCGCSSEMHQMKNKLIGEGYKFFHLHH